MPSPRLMLRAYNAEADYAVRSMRPHRVSSLVDRLYKSRETIARLGATMHIRNTDEYHNARVRECREHVTALAGRPLIGPQPGVRPVAPGHRSWHTRQVFRGSPRPSAV